MTHPQQLFAPHTSLFSSHQQSNVRIKGWTRKFCSKTSSQMACLYSGFPHTRSWGTALCHNDAACGTLGYHVIFCHFLEFFFLFLWSNISTTSIMLAGPSPSFPSARWTAFLNFSSRDSFLGFASWAVHTTSPPPNMPPFCVACWWNTLLYCNTAIMNSSKPLTWGAAVGSMHSLNGAVVYIVPWGIKAPWTTKYCISCMLKGICHVTDTWGHLVTEHNVKTRRVQTLPSDATAAANTCNSRQCSASQCLPCSQPVQPAPAFHLPVSPSGDERLLYLSGWWTLSHRGCWWSVPWSGDQMASLPALPAAVRWHHGSLATSHHDHGACNSSWQWSAGHGSTKPAVSNIAQSLLLLHKVIQHYSSTKYLIVTMKISGHLTALKMPITSVDCKFWANSSWFIQTNRP